MNFHTNLKIENFQYNIFDIFLIFAQNIDCAYTEAVLVSTHNLCFRANFKFQILFIFLWFTM